MAPLSPRSLTELAAPDAFVGRHIGPSDAEVAAMLGALGLDSLDALLDAVVPPAIRDDTPLAVPPARDEAAVLAALRELAAANRPRTSLIGTGWYGTVTPAVIRRNVLENPAWYTAYTPYQPEISQGRLEALLTFQTMVCDLTGTEIANASMLDEATAAAEGMTLLHRAQRGSGDVFVVDPDTHPQTIAVIETRAEPLGLEVAVTDPAGPLPDGTFGVLISHPGSSGAVRDIAGAIAAAHDAGALVVVATDLLACALLTPPGELGADVVVGSSQRFGVPLGFGGPSAGFLATSEAYRRSLPGRLVGVSIDTAGRPAYRLALQTREQHIRREKATSNICTAQVLLAVMAALYAVWHGPEGLRRIAQRVHRLTAVCAAGLRQAGAEVVHDDFFDTLVVKVSGRADDVLTTARTLDLELRSIDADHVGMSFDEASTPATVSRVWAAFGVDGPTVDGLDGRTPDAVPSQLVRTSEFCTHPVFHSHRSETDMMRYLRRLSDADLALDRAMIPLGSCTMKLNAAAEMEPVSWPGFADLHPFAPPGATEGYRRLIADLEAWLADITGYDAVSLQPNAGSQGELAGLLAIRAWHRSRGDDGRTVCLIPASAHGTNGRQCRHGRDAGGGRGVRRRRQRRPRRPADQARPVRRRVGCRDDHLPLDPRGVRAEGRGPVRGGARRRRAGLPSTAPTSTPSSGWPDPAASAPTSATSTSTRPSASPTVAVVPGWVRWPCAATWPPSCPATRWCRAPAPPVWLGTRSDRWSARCRAHRGARRGSFPSRGPTCR